MRPRPLPLLVALAVAAGGCTSTVRVRLADPATLAELRARDETVDGRDLADHPVAVRARAILEVAPPEEDGLRPATVRDGRGVRWLGGTLILLGIGSGLAVAAAGAGTTAVEPGILLGASVAGLGVATGVPCVIAGAAAGSPVVE